MNEFKTMKVEVYQCNKCKQWIYSRARHDMKYCKCGLLGVDGGHMSDENVWVAERLTNHLLDKKVVTIEANNLILYNDWNESENEWGVYEDE